MDRKEEKEEEDSFIPIPILVVVVLFVMDSSSRFTLKGTGSPRPAVGSAAEAAAAEIISTRSLTFQTENVIHHHHHDGGLQSIEACGGSVGSSFQHGQIQILQIPISQ